MKERHTSNVKPLSMKIAWFALIIASATMAGMISEWRAPGVSRYAQDSLMRARGTLSVPDDIVIIAIDEASISRLGQFPWRRELTARVLDIVSASQPKVLALDVLYVEPTEPEDDRLLAEAVNRAGNVVLGEQLTVKRESIEPEYSSWLNLLPEIKNGAAGSGHVHVPTEHDGTAREIILRLADDESSPRWALAVETIRVGDRLATDSLSETNEFVQIGKRRVPYESEGNYFPLDLKDEGGRFSVLQPMRMRIDYIGPSGSFAPQTYSFADVLEGRFTPETFRGKYVLIGATAAALGDKIATPFVHAEDDAGGQNGELMPGVEILANSLDTILRGRFYQGVSESISGLSALLIAATVLLLIRLAEGRYEAGKQIFFLAGLGGLILIGSFAVYVNFFIIPPVVPMIVSLSVAAPLALLRRSLAASAGIDDRISELLAIEKNILTNGSSYIDDFPEYGSIKATNGKRTGILPRGLEWKMRTLKRLSGNLIEHSLFIDRSLRTLDEGLLIAGTDGSIIFANSRAAAILSLPQSHLIGSNLFASINNATSERGYSAEQFSEKIVLDLLSDRSAVKREIIIGDSDYYQLRLSAVILPGDSIEKVIGIVATLADITEQRELQKVKNDVITLVTHELRTPLTAIQGMSEVLSEHDDIEPESRRKMLTAINAESKRLARMINEYLDITRIESGMQKARFGSVDLISLFEQTLTMLEPLAWRREIKFIRHFAFESAVIVADAALLAQALTNVVGNAVKYSAAETTITIKIGADGDQLHLSVTDEGFGISAEQLPHIFEKFYRVPHRRASEVPGTGLGLALTREVIELHGGRITVESEPNVGSTFTICLPFAPKRQDALNRSL